MGLPPLTLPADRTGLTASALRRWCQCGTRATG